jgi:hypothetical protein
MNNMNNYGDDKEIITTTAALSMELSIKMPDSTKYAIIA